jgi:hypothetical protein
MTTVYLDGEFPKGMKETTTRENGYVFKVAMINKVSTDSTWGLVLRIIEVIQR